MPKQNRPLVRDGRLQARKKRTDRSYLRPDGAATAVADEPAVEDEGVAEAALPEAADVAAEAPTEEAPAASTASAPTATNGTATPASGAPTRATGTVRALQQQGVRKRREFDVQALAVRDSKYAMHELRRIAILATMVVITLIVLSFVLR